MAFSATWSHTFPSNLYTTSLATLSPFCIVKLIIYIYVVVIIKERGSIEAAHRGHFPPSEEGSLLDDDLSLVVAFVLFDQRLEVDHQRLYHSLLVAWL